VSSLFPQIFFLPPWNPIITKISKLSNPLNKNEKKYFFALILLTFDIKVFYHMWVEMGKNGLNETI